MSEKRTRPEHLPGRRLEEGEIPTLPSDRFLCTLTHCRLLADVCCRRQLWFKPGTPEPFWPYCKKTCPLGRQVREAMPKDYVPKPPPWAFRGRPAPTKKRSGPDES
jgi:hypothetical protein